VAFAALCAPLRALEKLRSIRVSPERERRVQEAAGQTVKKQGV
jgi:hypothetical protein